MKHYPVFVASLLFVCLCYAVAAKPVLSSPEATGPKVYRGVVDIGTCLIEIPMQVHKGYAMGAYKSEDKVLPRVAGLGLGMLRAVPFAAARLDTGVMNLFGFWAAFPESNQTYGVPYDAEYAWEMGNIYRIYDPNLQEGFRPCTNKLARGVRDFFFGFAEIPGQFKKYSKRNRPFLGACKGVWFFASRELHGLNDIITFLLPNHRNNYGKFLEEGRPWDACYLGEY